MKMINILALGTILLTNLAWANSATMRFESKVEQECRVTHRTGADKKTFHFSGEDYKSSKAHTLVLKGNTSNVKIEFKLAGSVKLESFDPKFSLDGSNVSLFVKKGLGSATSHKMGTFQSLATSEIEAENNSEVNVGLKFDDISEYQLKPNKEYKYELTATITCA